MTALRAVRWSFDGDSPVIHRGFTDDTYWNGALNVWVDAATHDAVVAELLAYEAAGGDSGGALAEMQAMQPNADGLYSYANGYMAQEVIPTATPDEHEMCACGEYPLCESDGEDGYFPSALVESEGTDAVCTHHTHGKCWVVRS